jgi:ADP-ribose pyrophosphatase
MRKLVTMATRAHHKCRTAYQGGVERSYFSDDKVDWKVSFPDYAPVDFTHAVVLKKPVWADPDPRTEKDFPPFKWNELDGKNDRRSHEGKYEIVDGLPRNPRGRTGMIGRGLLGKWGPNHAADPVVTRFVVFFLPFFATSKKTKKKKKKMKKRPFVLTPCCFVS